MIKPAPTQGQLVLAPSHSNPSIRRWQSTGGGNASPREETAGALHGFEATAFLKEVRDGGKVYITEARSRRGHVQAAVQYGLVSLVKLPDKYTHAYVAALTPSGVAWLKGHEELHARELRERQVPLFKGVRLFVRLTDLIKAIKVHPGQLGLFGAPRPIGTTTIQVKEHFAHNPGGAGMHVVHSHPRKVEPGEEAAQGIRPTPAALIQPPQEDFRDIPTEPRRLPWEVEPSDDPIASLMEVRHLALSIIPASDIARWRRYESGEVGLPEGHTVPRLDAGWISLANEFRALLRTTPELTVNKARAVYGIAIAEQAQRLRDQLELLDQASGKSTSFQGQNRTEVTTASKYSLIPGYELKLGAAGLPRWHRIDGFPGDGDAPFLLAQPSPEPVRSTTQTRNPQPIVPHGLDALLEHDEATPRGGAEGDVDLMGQSPDLLFLLRDKFAGIRDGDPYWNHLGLTKMDGDPYWDHLGLTKIFKGNRGDWWMHVFISDQIGKAWESISPRQRGFITLGQRSFENVWHGLALEDREKVYREYFKPHLGGAKTWPDQEDKQNEVLLVPKGMAKMVEKGWKAHPYQAKAVNWFCGSKNEAGDRRGSFLMEMGLGKTLAAELAYHTLKERGEVDRLFIVAPTSTHGSWDEHINGLSDSSIAWAAGGPKKRLAAIQAWGRGEHDVLIITPESLADKKYRNAIESAMLGESPEETEDRIEREIPASPAQLARAKRCLRVADEVHKFKNPEAQRTKAAATIFDLPGPALGMTGTPQPNKPEDLYHTQAFIDRHAFATLKGYKGDARSETERRRMGESAFLRRTMSEGRFIDDYTSWYVDRNTGERVVVGYDRTKQDELRAEISKRAFVRTLKDEDVTVSLPSMHTLTPSIPLSPEQNRVARWAILYTEWEQSIRRDEARARGDGPGAEEAANRAERERIRIEEHADAWSKKDPMAGIGYRARVGSMRAVIGLLKQIASAPEAALQKTDRHLWEKVASLETPKMSYCLDAAQEHLETNPGRGVVIMGEYHGVLDAAHRGLVKRGVRPEDIVRIDGTVPPEKRREIERNFNSGKHSVLLAGTSAVETGANLQKNSSFLVHLTTPYNPTTLTQSTARVWRQGQKHPTTVVRPIGSPIERVIERIVGRKLAETAIAMGGTGAGESYVAQSLNAKRLHEPEGLDDLLESGSKFDEEMVALVGEPGIDRDVSVDSLGRISALFGDELPKGASPP